MSNEFHNDPEGLERQRLEAERQLNQRRAYASGSGFGWWWAWFWIFIIALFLWFGGWGWWGYGGWWGWGANRRIVYVQPPAGEVAVSVPTLLGNPASFDGKRVLLPAATVQQVINNRTAWVGPNTNEEVLVSLSSSSPVQNLSQGERVDVSGMANKPQNNQQNLGLNANDSSRVKSEGIVLQVAIATHPPEFQQQQPVNRGHGG